jgi:hypothetical protein
VRYQLVLQFTANNSEDFDELVALEERLNKGLDSIALVDGHDFGQSEFNIFILTDRPVTVFDKAHETIRGHELLQHMRAAYRESDGENYEILWPPT